jgi:hypothetical protein
VRQKGEARERRKGLAFSEFRLDGLDGAVAGADEQFSDAIGGEFIKIGGKLAEFLDDAHRCSGHGLQFFGERQALAAGFS